MEPTDSEKSIIKTIISLFRTKGELLLNGEGFLSLSASSVVALNASFERIRETDLESSFEATSGSCTTFPHNGDIQLLYDFVQKLVKLKISHKHNSLPGRVNLAPFRGLRQLELKGVPLHLMIGIAKIRPHLQSLSCTRCLPALKDILEQCGGDKSEASLGWSDLTALYLRNNNLTELDSSLRLVPMLTTLDVSHNSVETTSDCLEYLTELKALNLSFNNLKNIPTVALSCRPRLCVLLLKYNGISSIAGVKELTGLHELDLRGNLIASHAVLYPILPLSRLRKLFLDENPICYHKQHLRLTIQCLHISCVTQILIDGKRLSRQELKHHETASRTLIGSPRHALLVNDGGVDQSMEFYDSFNVPSPMTSQSEAEIAARVVILKKKKGKGKKKARKANISDMDDTQDNQSVDSAKGSYSDDNKELKEEIERMRSEMGPDWLQGLQKHLPQEVYSSDSIADGLIQQQQEKSLQSSTAPVGVVGVGKEEKTDNVKSSVAVKDSGTTQNQDTRQGKLDEKPTLLIASPTPGRGTPASGRATPAKRSLSRNSDGRKTPGTGRKTPGLTSQSRPKSSTSMIWQSTRNGSDQPSVDYGPESEPFIVCPVDDPDEEYIITVSERYLLEKDINGDVTEELDLKCLLEVSADQQAVPTMGDDVMFCVKMMFDYVNKNKRDRHIVMEDEDASIDLCKMLKPIAQANRDKEKMKNTQQCLKCNHEFVKLPSKRHSRNSSLGRITRISSFGKNIDQLPKGAIEGFQEEKSICPKCGSDLVIECAPEQVAAANSNYTTPVGSLTTTSSLATNVLTIPPLATSSTNTTPVREVKADNGAGAIWIGGQAKKKMPWESTNVARSIPDTITSTGENSSFISCNTDLSQSYKSLKEAVLLASTNSTFKSDISSTRDSGSKHNSPIAIGKKLQNTQEWITNNPQSSAGASSKAQESSKSELNFIESRDETDFNQSSEHMKIEGTAGLGNKLKNSNGHQISTNLIGASGTDLPIIRNSSSKETNVDECGFLKRQSESDIIILKDPYVDKSSSDYGSSDKSSQEAMPQTKSDSLPRKKDLGITDARNDSNLDSAQNLGCDNAFVRILDSDQVITAGQLETFKDPGVSNSGRVETFEDNLNLAQSEGGISEVRDHYESNTHANNLSPVHEDMMSQSKSLPRAKENGNISETNSGKTLARRQSSDIVVLNEDENNYVAFKENDIKAGTNGNFIESESETTETERNGKPQADDGTVYGSLTNSAVCNMVDYMRSSTYDSSTSSSRELVDTKVKQENEEESIDFSDFNQIDHRLQLHLMMNVFRDEHEEFQLSIKCGVVQYTKGVENSGLLVASNSHLYIFNITGTEKLDKIENWLKLQHSQHLTEIRYVDIGLGYQSFRIEFGMEATCFDFIVRDEIQCKTFIAQFTALLQDTSFTAKSQLEGISKNNPTSMLSLMRDVIKPANQKTENEACDDDATMLKYIKCFNISDTNARKPVSVVITHSLLCLAQENYKLPVPKISEEQQKSICLPTGKQFNFLESIDVTDIARVEICHTPPVSIDIIHALPEVEESSLKLQFSTDRSKISFLGALQMAYKEQLDIDLDVNVRS